MLPQHVTSPESRPEFQPELASKNERPFAKSTVRVLSGPAYGTPKQPLPVRPLRQPSYATMAQIVRLGLLWIGRHRLAGLETPVEKSGRKGHATATRKLVLKPPRARLNDYSQLSKYSLATLDRRTRLTRRLPVPPARSLLLVLPCGGVNRIDGDVALVISSWSWHEDVHAVAASFNNVHVVVTIGREGNEV